MCRLVIKFIHCAVFFLLLFTSINSAFAQAHWQKDQYIIDSFVNIALKREYIKGVTTKLNRWRAPLNIFIESEIGDEKFQRQIYAVQANHLTMITGHPVNIVESADKANVFIVFTSKSKMKVNALKYMPTISNIDNVLKHARCMASIKSNKKSEIIRGMVVIPVNTTIHSGHFIDCIVEELTQMMGLPNDSVAVYPSIFNDRSIDTYISGLDYLLLKIAYDPLLKAGMSEKQVRATLPAVLDKLKRSGDIENAQKRVLKGSLQMWLETTH